MKDNNDFEKEGMIDEIDEMVIKEKKKHGNLHFRAITTKPIVA